MQTLANIEANETHNIKDYVLSHLIKLYIIDMELSNILSNFPVDS